MGHREQTLNGHNGVHWLRDLLPTDLPHARILCWGYDSNTHGERVSYNHARSLVADFRMEGRLSKERSKLSLVWAGSIDAGKQRRDL
jgi:hypothetical protein